MPLRPERVHIPLSKFNRIRRGVAKNANSSGFSAWVTISDFGETIVGLIQGKALFTSSSSASLAFGTFDQITSHNLGMVSSIRIGDNSVNNGPPPRIDVRCPAPPDGAKSCIVINAAAAYSIHNAKSAARFMNKSLLLRTAFSPGASISRPLIGFDSAFSNLSKSWKTRILSPSKSKYCAYSERASSISSRGGGDFIFAAHSLLDCGAQIRKNTPMINSVTAAFQSCRGKSRAVIGLLSKLLVSSLILTIFFSLFLSLTSSQGEVNKFRVIAILLVAIFRDSL